MPGNPRSLRGTDIFEQRYAERSGTTVAYLHAHGRHGARCTHQTVAECDEVGCEGYEMLHRDDFDHIFDRNHV